MPDARISTFHADVDKVIHFLMTEYSKLQTGRANASLVEHIDVDVYGQKMQMRAVAGISIADGRTIVIQPWDRSALQAVEKAITQVDIGVNPVNDGSVIRLNLPPMTEERRQQLVKIVQKLAEDARISVRQARQKSHDDIKAEPNETLRNALQDQLQKEVDTANERIDDARKQKEEEVMKV